MKQLMYYLKPFRKSILAIFLFVLLQALADLYLPNFMSKIVDEGIVSKDILYILKIGLLMLLVALLGGLASILLNYFASKVGAGLAKNMRHDIFKKVESFSLMELESIGTNSLITRTTNDVNQIQMTLTLVLRLAFLAPMMGVGAIILAISKSSSMSLIILGGILVICAFIFFIFRVVSKQFDLLQKLLDKTNLITRENLKGVKIIRAFHNEKTQHQKFVKVIENLENVNWFINKMAALMSPVMNFILNMVTILILWMGSKYIAGNLLGVGDMMAFMQYAMQIMMSFLMFSVLFILVPRAMISLARIKEVLTYKEEISSPQFPKKPKPTEIGTIEFRHVSFRYPEGKNDVLKDISFSLKKGETLIIIGSTGSGKSTLMNLILRFYDVTKGSIFIDGVDVRDYDIEQLRKKIGYVPQKNILFAKTIKENVLYGAKKQSDDVLKRATDIAQATSFILDKEKQFLEPVSEEGNNLSGGQKQRLAIARALASDPEILLFDDSFSAVDLKTDRNIKQALEKKEQDKTKLIVTQRIDRTFQHAKIMVLEKGQVVGLGTHQSLMKSCKVYQEIEKSQHIEEEVS